MNLMDAFRPKVPLSINGVALPILVIQKAITHAAKQPRSKRRNKRGNHLSDRALAKQAMHERYVRACHAQRVIEGAFAKHAGMRWVDVERDLKERGWTWRQIQLLAQSKGLVKEPEAPKAKPKTGLLVPAKPKLIV